MRLANRGAGSLDPIGLPEKEDPDDFADRFWRPRGGTPHGIPHELAPAPMEPAHDFWLEIDAELAGGRSDDGCNYLPAALELVLGWYREPIRVWFASYCSMSGWWSEEEVMMRARRILRYIAMGRADALSEL